MQLVRPKGVLNIIRFNYHFYLLSGGFIVIALLITSFLPHIVSLLLKVASLLMFLVIICSLIASYYVYDCSGLYILNWLDGFNIGNAKAIVNIHAGLDETSRGLSAKFPGAKISCLDFYDPETHTEISIKRARKIYPAPTSTLSVKTNELLLPDHSADIVFIFLSAHEIRDKEERILFFKEVRRILKPNGQIIVSEHLRDLNNFLAYNIGFLHFFSERQWREIFKAAGLQIKSECKLATFIKTFILQNGVTS